MDSQRRQHSPRRGARRALPLVPLVMCGDGPGTSGPASATWGLPTIRSNGAARSARGHGIRSSSSVSQPAPANLRPWSDRGGQFGPTRRESLKLPWELQKTGPSTPSASWLDPRCSKRVKDLRGKTKMSEQLIDVWRIALCGSLETLDLAHPARQWVPTGENLASNLISNCG